MLKFPFTNPELSNKFSDWYDFKFVPYLFSVYENAGAIETDSELNLLDKIHKYYTYRKLQIYDVAVKGLVVYMESYLCSLTPENRVKFTFSDRVCVQEFILWGTEVLDKEFASIVLDSGVDIEKDYKNDFQQIKSKLENKKIKTNYEIAFLGLLRIVSVFRKENV